MCMCVLFPMEESQTWEAIQRAPPGQAKDVEGLTRHGPHQSSNGHKPEQEGSGEHFCVGKASRSMFIHGREDLENVTECQPVTPE